MFKKHNHFKNLILNVLWHCNWLSLFWFVNYQNDTLIPGFITNIPFNWSSLSSPSVISRVLSFLFWFLKFRSPLFVIKLFVLLVLSAFFASNYEPLSFESCSSSFNDYLTEQFIKELQSFEFLFTYHGIFFWFKWRSFHFHLIARKVLICYIDCKYHVRDTL